MMRGAMGLLGAFGFGVGCYGVLSWITSYDTLMAQPAVVAGPQLIVMTLQALLGFLLLVVASAAVEITQRLDQIKAAIEATTTRRAAPAATPEQAAAPMNRGGLQNWGDRPLVRRLPDDPALAAPKAPRPVWQVAMIIAGVIGAMIVLLAVMPRQH